MTVVSNIGRDPPPPLSPGMCWMLWTNPWKKEIARTWQDDVNSYLTCHRQDKATDIYKYYEKYDATHPSKYYMLRLNCVNVKIKGCLNERWLESHMIMLIRTLHHVDVVLLIQDNQYVIMDEKKVCVSPFSYCTWESVLPSWTWGLVFKKATYWYQNISWLNNPFNHMMLNMKQWLNSSEFVGQVTR